MDLGWVQSGNDPPGRVGIFKKWVDPRDALLLKQMRKNQTGFVLLLKQNKSDLVVLH